MPDIRYIDKDFVRFTFTGSGGADEHAILVFGDKVDVLQEGSGSTPSRVRALELFDGTLEGTVKGKPFRSRDKGVLKFSMVDVQQGDGMVLETPPDGNDETRLVFIDGGDNKLFARHVAARYRHRQSSPTSPLEVDLILITHGDADHFDGLVRHQAIRDRTRDLRIGSGSSSIRGASITTASSRDRRPRRSSNAWAGRWTTTGRR